MICRRCPVCGGEWYSAYTGPWPCAYCGAIMQDGHNEPLPEIELEIELEIEEEGE